MKRVLVSAFLACSCVWAQSGLSVEAFDEQSNNNSQLTLRLRLKNNTADTLKNIQAKYLIERDDSRTLNVYPYYMPNATYTLDTLSDYLVVNINVDAIAPGYYPNESGISLGMVYTDGKNFYKDSDYSYPGKGNFKSAPNIVVMQNGAWLTGELPSSMTAAKLRFKAIQPENSDTRSAWVEIENYGQESVNLSRFVLKNSASHSASIGDFTLKHGDKIRVCQDITLECPVDNFSTVIQSLSFGNEGEIKLALGSKTIDYVAWGKQGTMGDFDPLPTIPYEEIGMYESYYKGAFFRYIDYIGWKIFAANEINRNENSLPLARDYNLPDGTVVVFEKNKKPRFSWVKVNGASSYVLTVLSAKDSSLVYQEQTEKTFVDVDISGGEYLWNVHALNVDYGFGFDIDVDEVDGFRYVIFILEDDEPEYLLANKKLLNAPKIGARKDTKLLATSMGHMADKWGWNRAHSLSEEMTPEETWRCWAVGFNILNGFYKGTLTQDEIKIMGMKSKGEKALDYFALGQKGGSGTKVKLFEDLYKEIFDMDLKVVFMSDGKLDPDDIDEEKATFVMTEDDKLTLDIEQIKKAVLDERPVYVSILNWGNSSGHVMVVDGYATFDNELENTKTGEIYVPRNADFLHFVNTDNNANDYWAIPSTYKYQFFILMPKPKFVLNRDPLLAQKKLDTDEDGVIDYDEKYRFKTEINDDDSDDDGVNDYYEIYAMTKRCTDISKTVETDGKSVTEYYGCKEFVYENSDGDELSTYLDPDSDNGGIIDGAEDLNGNGVIDPGERDPYDESDDETEIVNKPFDVPYGITLYAHTRLLLNDVVKCYNGATVDDGFCDIANSNNTSFSTTILGVKAEVKNIITRGGVWLRRAKVHGTVDFYTLPKIKHALDTQNGATTDGGEPNYYNTIAYPYPTTYDTWTLENEPETEHVVKNGETFEWDSEVVYKSLKVEAGGKLILNPGTFVTKNLLLDRGSDVEFAKPGEATVVVALDKVHWRCNIVNEDLPLIARGFKLITYMQDERLFTLGTNWAGTLYAPKTYAILGQSSNKLLYGRFLADILIVHQTSKIARVDFDPIVPEVIPEEDEGEEEEEQEPAEGEQEPTEGEQEPVVASDDPESSDDEEPSEQAGDAFAKRHFDNDKVQESVVSSLAAELKGFSRNGIAFETKSAGIVKISIMSANGIMVKSVSTGNLEAGKHTVAWNSENVPSGRYLVTLSQNGKVSGKFVSLK